MRVQAPVVGDERRARRVLARDLAKAYPTTRAAVKALKRVRLDPPVADANKLVKRWAHRRTVADAGGRGPKPKVADALALKLARLYKAGWKDCDGVQRNFRNVKHAKDMSAEFRRQAAKLTCIDRTVERAMHRADPTLATVQEEVKPSYSSKEMAGRVKCCDELARMPDGTFEGTEWLDEGSWGMTKLGTHRAAGERGHPKVVTDTRVPKGTSGKHIINFAISVNAVVGASTITFLPGTQGLKPDKQYKVGCTP